MRIHFVQIVYASKFIQQQLTAMCTQSHTLYIPALVIIPSNTIDKMKTILTYILLLSVIACSDSEYYKVQFDNVHGLASGNKVFIKGLEVGEVKDLGIDDDKKVLATIWVGRNIKLTKGSTFTIHSNVFGRHIEIGLSDSKEIINADEIQKGYVQPPDTTRVRKYTKEERDSLVKNDPIYRLMDTVFHILRKPRTRTQ